MKTELLKEYRNLKEEIKILEAKESEIKEEIMADMKKEKNNTVDTEFGKFTIGERMVWTYTKQIKKMSEKLKLTKIKEEKSGKAKYKITSYLVYTKV